MPPSARPSAIRAWAARAQAPRSVVAIVLAGILIACLLAAVTRTWRRFFLAQFPLALLTGAFVLYTLLFQMPPGRTLALLLLGASGRSSRDSEGDWFGIH